MIFEIADYFKFGTLTSQTFRLYINREVGEPLVSTVIQNYNQNKGNPQIVHTSHCDNVCLA